MHPAFSVILFTTLSGSGFGLLALLGLMRVVEPAWLWRGDELVLYAVGFALAVAGLVASLWHLGRPARAWRAFSQWRSSWLSREGVAAVATLAAGGAAAGLVWRGAGPPPVPTGAALWATSALLALGSLVTLACTAMIYASLPPVPAWRDRAVLPVYLGYGLLGGGFWLGAVLALVAGAAPVPAAAGVAALLALSVGLLKAAYWRRIDRQALPTAAAAVGLPALGTVRTFERPHTQDNYLLREMGFVLARRHARRLRRIALALGLALPVALLALAAAWPRLSAPACLASACTFQLGALVERWLFFAQARHTVQAYYGVALPD